MRVFRFTYLDTTISYDMVVLARKPNKAYKLIREKLDLSGIDSKKFISKQTILMNLVEYNIETEQVVSTEVKTIKTCGEQKTN